MDVRSSPAEGCIDTQNVEQLLEWCARLCVRPEALVAAVEEVGADAERVRIFLASGESPSGTPAAPP